MANAGGLRPIALGSRPETANAALSELSKLLQELACFGVRACSHLHRLPGEDREVGTAPHSGPRQWDLD